MDIGGGNLTRLIKLREVFSRRRPEPVEAICLDFQFDAAVLKLADSSGLRCVTGNVETDISALRDGGHDLIIMRQLIEHLRDPRAALRLVECGVEGIDCSGAGGTSWAKVEALCATDARRRAIGLRFGEWGIPTATSIANVRRVAPALPLIASGGLRSGVDLAKTLALGANLGAMARPFLLKADEGEDALHAFVQDVLEELRICMFGTGADSVAALRGRLDAIATATTRCKNQIGLRRDLLAGVWRWPRPRC